MVYYLVTQKHCYTMHPFLTYWAKDFNQHLKILTYPSLFVRSTLDPGTYIFSDIERLTPDQTQTCSHLWSLLKETAGFQPVNHPSQSMRRYELLRTLYEQDINVFNIYRLTEISTSLRFPVFIRWENEHKALSPLLQNQKELINAIGEFKNNLKGKIIVEFCDTSDHEGIFRKYSAYYVNSRVLPIHIMYSRQWFVKSGVRDNSSAQKEERDYIETNSHKNQIEHIFKIARIDYGRIDYSMLDGKLQVWEINTNPYLLPLRNPNQRKEFREYFLKRFKGTLSNLDDQGQTSPTNLPMKSVMTQESKGLAILPAASHRINNWYYFTSYSPNRITQKMRRIVRSVC
jgi:hypothetical protein